METREFLNTADGFAKIIEENYNSIKDSYDDIIQCEDAQKKGIQLYDNDNESVILSSREDIISDFIELIFKNF